MKLIFFIAAHVLCFRFAEQCSHSLKDSPVFHPKKGTWVGQEAAKGHSQDSRPKVTKGYSIHYNIVLSNKIEEERRWKGEHLQQCCLPSQISSHMWWTLHSWKWPADSKQWISCFALLVTTAFSLSSKPSLSQTASFLAYTLPILFSSHCAKLLTRINLQLLEMPDIFKNVKLHL